MRSKRKSSAIAKAIDDAIFDKVGGEEVPEENEETQAKIVDTNEEEDDDIFDQDFSRQEKPSKLRILNASKLDRDEKYMGKKISRKSLHSFGDSDEDEGLEEDTSDLDDSEDEADDDEEHAVAELGHMFEMDGVEYNDEDDPGLRNKRRQAQHVFEGLDEEAQLSNDSDAGSEVSEESNVDGDNGDSVDEGSSEDEEVERIKDMILKSKVDDSGSEVEDNIEPEGESNDEGTDENSESGADSNDEEDEDDIGFDLSSAEAHSKTDNEDKFDTFKPINVDSEVSKGNAIKSQLKLWDSLLELRIALQKSLVKVNQLPQVHHWHIYKSESEAGNENNDTIKKCQKNLAKILDTTIGQVSHKLLLF